MYAPKIDIRRSKRNDKLYIMIEKFLLEDRDQKQLSPDQKIKKK